MRRAEVSLLVWTVCAACRFGGPSGSATELVEPYADAGADAGGDDDEVLPPSEPPGGAPAVAPPETPDASTSNEGCGPTNVPGCDPVSGSQCTPGINQCVVDPSAAVPAGRCIFSSTPPAAGCEENDLYSTCPPLFTCKRGECRKYCYCDSDCDVGDSCSEPTGQGAASLFKLCVETRP